MTSAMVMRHRSCRNATPRELRAIPNNAILQQLGFPVNIIAGAGTAAAEELEAVAELLADSPRGRQLIRLVRASNNLASIKTLAAYGELFNSAYWATRPYRGSEDDIADACLALAEHLVGDDRLGAFRRVASRLRVDGAETSAYQPSIATSPTPSNAHVARRQAGRQCSSTTGTAASRAR